MIKKDCPKCEGTGKIHDPNSLFQVGDRIKAINMGGRKGKVVCRPLSPPVSYVEGGSFPDKVYVVQFDTGEISLMGEGAIRTE